VVVVVVVVVVVRRGDPMSTMTLTIT
jgi:hypothetical protein